jgi:hypothetical protein
MATLATSLSPTGTFEHLDEHFAVHGGYYTHQNQSCEDRQLVSTHNLKKSCVNGSPGI